MLLSIIMTLSKKKIAEWFYHPDFCFGLLCKFETFFQSTTGTITTIENSNKRSTNTLQGVLINFNFSSRILSSTDCHVISDWGKNPGNLVYCGDDHNWHTLPNLEHQGLRHTGSQSTHPWFGTSRSATQCWRLGSCVSKTYQECRWVCLNLQYQCVVDVKWQQ